MAKTVLLRKNFATGLKIPRCERATPSSTASLLRPIQNAKSLSTRLDGPAGQNCTLLCNGLGKNHRYCVAERTRNWTAPGEYDCSMRMPSDVIRCFNMNTTGSEMHAKNCLKTIQAAASHYCKLAAQMLRLCTARRPVKLLRELSLCSLSCARSALGLVHPRETDESYESLPICGARPTRRACLSRY
jgi:hypothetical protein